MYFKKRWISSSLVLHIMRAARCHSHKIVSSYLGTEMEIAEKDGGLGAGDEQDDEDQEQESEHVVHLVWPADHKQHVYRTKWHVWKPRRRKNCGHQCNMATDVMWKWTHIIKLSLNSYYNKSVIFNNLPDAVENEEELDEYASERQDSAHRNPWQSFRVKWLVGNLARDLIGSYWMLNRLENKTKIIARNVTFCCNWEKGSTNLFNIRDPNTPAHTSDIISTRYQALHIWAFHPDSSGWISPQKSEWRARRSSVLSNVSLNFKFPKILGSWWNTGSSTVSDCCLRIAIRVDNQSYN